MKSLRSFWIAVGTSRSLGGALLRTLLYLIFALLTYQCVTLRFGWKQQAVVGFLTLVIVFVLFYSTKAYVSTIMLIVASLLTTARYAVWRVSQVYQAISNPSSDLLWIEIFFMLLLLAAEMYAFSILLLGFIQTVYPLRRPPVPLPVETDLWPHIDLLIPTYNEPLSVVRSTAFASINIDYPPDKLHVYLLDDGRRDEFRTFCKAINIGYITRDDNLHAKAGNINRALTGLTSPLVAIFDCDHLPTRSFLQMTVGWFLKDEKLAMLQTPHHFYSPDPFERNLNSFGVVPNEGELFYGLLQDGNDLWNATFFCGSCAVLRRTALDEIGGIAVETVTEDAHTSLRLQTRGWNTAYINIPQAAGLATESLSAHVGQRIRWARGMVQILRIDNPLFAKGLRLSQRLCYFNAMVHFLYALPRLVFLTAPLIYMLFGLRNIPGLWLTIAAYAMPHLILSSVANSRLQGKYRHSFWNEVYETVLAPYILGPTLLALINPKLGKFNVTAKGGIVEKRYFDTIIARPYRHLLLLNYIGLAIAPWRYFVHNADHQGAVLMNVFWILFNCVVLGTASAAAIEQKQLRSSVRLNRTIELWIQSPEGIRTRGLSQTLSLGGGSAKLDHAVAVSASVEVVFTLDGEDAIFPARVVAQGGTSIRFEYLRLTMQQEEALTVVLYSKADSWIPAKARGEDRPLKALATIMRLSLRGIRYSLNGYLPKRRVKSAVASVLLCLITLAPAVMGGQPRRPEAADRSFKRLITMADMGSKTGVPLRGADSYANEPIVLSESEVAQTGILHLDYGFSPGLLPERSLITLSFNNTTLVTLPMPVEALRLNGAGLHADVPIPSELLATRNMLRIHLQAHYAAQCEDPSSKKLWAWIAPSSTLEVGGVLLPIANDLAVLPAPFYEKELSVVATRISLAFSSPPSPQLLQAAGAVSSWFGVQANSHKLTFPVAIGHLQSGHSVLIALNDSPLLTALGFHVQGPHIAMRVNPVDGISKVLVVSGDNDEQVLATARTLASGHTFAGDSAQVEPTAPPAARKIDDAPRWEQTTRESSLWNYAETDVLRSDGSQPIASYVRVPPDLFWGDEETIRLRLNYTYAHGRSEGLKGGSLRVTANGAQVSYIPLTMTGGETAIQKAEIPLPISNLRPFANTLLFEFLFPSQTNDFCRPLPPSNSSGTLLKSSSLDLHSFPHWASLPNLELFANAGFPFTRFADLSQTTVVLPQRPSEREIGTMLNLLAYFGAQTGSPANYVKVGGVESYGEDRSLLVIGSQSDIVTTPAVDASLPISYENGALSQRARTTLNISQGFWNKLSHLNKASFSDIGGTDVQERLDRSLGEPFGTLIEGIESPTVPTRSIVLVMLGRTEQDLFPAFAEVSSSAKIHGDVAIQHGLIFDSFSLGVNEYHVGEIGILNRCRAWLHERPWVGVLLPFLMGLLYAPWLLVKLEERARQRLMGERI